MAFGPNGDGRNDIFVLSLCPEFEGLLSLRVYNRWSGLLQSAPNGWDGEGALTGLYLWQAQAALINGEVVELKGEVLLAR